MSTTVLVVVAHGDDEALGCGGTIAAHAARGDAVHLLVVADGVTSRAADTDRAGREADTRAAAERLGIAARPEFLGFPDNRLDSVALLDVVQAVEAVVERVRPVVVYTHHGGDLNIDHAVVHRAVMTACRPLPGAPVRAIYGFEVPSSTEWSDPDLARPFVPQRFVGIGDHLQTKLEALACYGSEMRPFPHARSTEAVEALARLRGSQVGMPAAEAFTVLREVDGQ